MESLAILTLDNEVGSEDTHGGDTDAGLGGSVGGAQTGEDDGSGAAHSTEERLYCISVAVPVAAEGLMLAREGGRFEGGEAKVEAID